MINKINSFINKYILNIFIVYLLSHPIIDALVGTFNSGIILTIDYLIKIGFMVLALYYVFFIKKENRKYILILALYSILYLIVRLLSNNVDIIYEIKVLIKVIYFPVSLIFVISLLKDNNFDKKYLAKVFSVYVILIFLPNLFNKGNSSYAITKTGSVGFFESANMIGNTLSILFPFFIVTFIEKNKKIAVLFSIIYFYTLLTMGTKGPLLCVFIMLIYYLILLIIKLVKEKKYTKIIVLLTSFILLILLFIFMLPKTAFYKNLVIHLDFLNIKSFKDFFTFKNIDHFIFGSRFRMLSETFNDYKNSGIINMLFGIGYTSKGILKTCEMDYFVLLFHQGILGFIIVYFMYFKSLAKIFKVKHKDFTSKTILLSVILSILCAFFIGHTLDVPSVAIFVSTIIGISLKESRE